MRAIRARKVWDQALCATSGDGGEALALRWETKQVRVYVCVCVCLRLCLPVSSERRRETLQLLIVTVHVCVCLFLCLPVSVSDKHCGNQARSSCLTPNPLPQPLNPNALAA